MRKISLLGSPKVESSEGEVPRFRSQLTIALLGYLAAERRTVTREHLAALFWPDDELQRGRGKLRRELHNLAQILPGSWDVDRVHVRFRSDEGTTLDIDLLRHHQELAEWQAAADLLRGDFLEGITLHDNLEFETWLLGEQERWRQLGAFVMSALLDELAKDGRPQEALRYGRRLLRTNPWNEEAHYRMMLLLWQAGQPLAALRQFTGYQRHIAHELGVAPSPQMVDLAEQIKGELSRPAHNLPAPSSPFFGRERELADIAELLAAKNGRLLTLSGPGGIGKTRLALQAARQYYEVAQVATFIVSLQGVQTAGGLARAIAASARFTFGGALDPWAQLLRFLHARHMLLVLDNFEPLLPHAPLLTRLLANAPAVRLLVTSRERLHIQGETVYVVEGLDYAVDGERGESSCFLLFTQAAQYLQPAYRPVGDDISAIRRICQLSGGLPLAIELAAGWSNILTPQQIAGELASDLTILSTAARDVPPRHMSIAAAFNYSWERLAEREQEVMEKMSVFAGDFDLKAAAQIAGATPQLLQSLVNKSLLNGSAPGRFRLHELLRQFAGEKLAQSPLREQRVRDAHCTFYTELLRLYEMETKKDLGSVTRNVLRVSAEINNMLAAWQHAVANHLVDEIDRSVYSLNLCFEFQGHYREGLALFALAVEKWQRSGLELGPHALMRLMTHYGWLAQDLRQEQLAKRSFERALELSRELGQGCQADRALLDFFSGWTLHFHGQTEAGMARLERGRQLGRRAGYEFGYVLSTLALGEISCDRQDYQAAFDYVSQTPEDIGPFLLSLRLGHLALAHAGMDDFKAAESCLRQLVDLLYDLPMVPSMLYTTVVMAGLAGHLGDFRHAVALLYTCLNHPQIGGFARSRAEALLREFGEPLAAKTQEQLRSKAKAGRLEDSWLAQAFEVNALTISRLAGLLDSLTAKIPDRY